MTAKRAMARSAVRRPIPAFLAMKYTKATDSPPNTGATFVISQNASEPVSRCGNAVTK
ncbi:MAG: hypothetical protein V1934_02725 [Methanobacteriota archaeon]